MTPRSEEEGGTGPDTLYCIMTNEVQRSTRMCFPNFHLHLREIAASSLRISNFLSNK